MADGRDYFKASIDYSQFDKDAAHIRGTFSNIGKAAESEGARIDSSLKKVGATIAGVFTIQKASQFVKDVANIRGEFQQLEIAFETMLGSKAKADALMSQLIDTAAKTPFDLTGVANGAKQLLAYGTASEDVNATLIRLGDVAAGLSIPLNDLVYLYGTTQVQGRLFSKDVYQFMGRGIPIIKELSKELKVSENNVMELVTAGKVGFPEIQKVFENLTNAGGMFSGLMEKQSASITGQLANLSDAYDVMLNNIGKKSEGTFTSAIDIANSLVENYETVGKVIGGLIVTYGSYKAAVIALNVVQGLQTRIALQSALAGRTLTTVQGLQAVSARSMSGAYAILNRTMLANPAVLATATLVALGYTVYKLSNALSDAEISQNALNKATSDGKEKKEGLTSSTSKLVSVITSETSVIQEQILAYKELQILFPKALENLDLMAFKAMNATEQQRLLNKAIFEQGNLYKDAQISQAEALLAKIKDGSISTKEWGKAIEDARSILGVEGFFDHFTTQQSEVSGLLEAHIKGLKSARQEIKEETAKPIVFDSFDKQKEIAVKNISEIKQQLKDLREGKSSKDGGEEDFAKAIEEKAKELKTAEDKLSYLLTGKSSSDAGKKDNTVDKLKKEAQDKADLIQKISNSEAKAALDARSAELDNQQKLLDLQQDGFDKQQAQFELNHKKDILGIEKRAHELIEAKQQVEKDQWEKDGSKGTFVAKIQTIAGLSPEAQTELIASDVIAAKAKEKATDDLLKSILEKYQDYNARRLAIEKQFNDDLSALEKLPDSEQKRAAIAQLEKERKASIKAVNDEEAAELTKTTDLFVRLFTDASQQSVKQIRKVIDETQDLYDYLANTKDEDITANFGFSVEQLRNFKGDAEQLKAILDGLIAKKRELAGKSEFQAFSQSIGDAIKKIQKGGIENIGAGITDIGSAVNQFAPQVKQFGEDLGTIFGDEKLAEDIGLAADALTGLGTTAEGVGQIMSGDIVGGIQSVVSGVASLVTVFGKIKDRKKEKEIQKLQKQVELLDKAYQSLDRAINKAYSNDASKLISQQNEALEQQKVLIQQQIKKEEDKKKTDKGRIKEWQEQIEEINLLIEDNREKAIDAIFGQDIKSAIEEFSDAYVDAWSAGEDRANAMKDVVKKMIKGVVVEMLKSDLAPTVQKIRDKIQHFLADGIIDSVEQAQLDKMIEEATKQADSKYSWGDKYLSDDAERTGASKGFTTASQDSINELNGEFYAIRQTANDIRLINGAIRVDVASLNKQAVSIKEIMSFNTEILGAQLEVQRKIETNTSKSAHILGNIETYGVKLKPI